MKISIWAEENKKLRTVLRNMRKKKGLTQTELADRLKMPRTFVTKYETARRSLSFIDVMKICDALGVDILELIKILDRK